MTKGINLLFLFLLRVPGLDVVVVLCFFVFFAGGGGGVTFLDQSIRSSESNPCYLQAVFCCLTFYTTQHGPESNM